MTVALTTFQRTVMSDVIRQHEAATDHTPFCCETVARYQAQLAESVPQQIAPATRKESASRPAKPASEKQINFIKVLMDKKVVTIAERAQDPENMSSAEANKFIQDLLKREDDIQGQIARKAERVNRVATQKQTDYLTSLAAQRDWPKEGPIADIIRAVLAEEVIGAAEASKAIERLLSCPKVEKPEVGEEGVYFFQGDYYKVKRAIYGSGKLYSTKFDREMESWSRGGSVRKLTEQYKLTAEQASEFGHLYGQCVSCHLPLTREESIDHGYGKKCAENNGWPY